MRFIIERAALERALAMVCPYARASVIKILTTIKIEAAESVALTASDLDSQICRNVAAEVQERGAACVDAVLLKGLVASCPVGAQIEIDATAETLRFRSGRISAKLGVIDPADFPIRDTSQSFSHNFEVPAAELARIFRRVAFAISTETTRYYLCGVHLVERGGKFIIEATDGHVLARIVMPSPSGSTGLPDTIVPESAIDFAIELGNFAEDPVSVRVGQSLIAFETRGLVFSSRLIDGVFPDADRVIPPAAVTPIKIDKTVTLRPLLNFSRLVEQSNDRQREVRIAFADREMQITGKLPNGDFADSVDCSAGRSVSETFNVIELRDALGSFDQDEIELHYGENTGTPWLLRESGSTDGSLVVVTVRR